jgi:hypoxanthine phosphoribosyltransferase
MLKTKSINKLSEDVSKILIDEEELEAIVDRLANEITDYYAQFVSSGDKLVVLGLLNGSVQFMADLVRKIDLPLEMQFAFTSSYGAGTVSSGKVQIHMGKCEKVLDDPTAHILVIEDIIDSGNTLSEVLRILNTMNNKSVRLCSLLDKPERRTTQVYVDWIGAQVPDEFVIGYGLDYNEKYRNLPYIGVLKREVYEK